jgi:hypothetical protein
MRRYRSQNVLLPWLASSASARLRSPGALADDVVRGRVHFS